MNIDQHTALNLVIGNPLKHSKSPLLHRAIYEALGLNAVLIARPQSNLKDLIAAIRTLSIGLCAVTMPFKEEVIHYLDICSPEVQTLQTANTIIQHDGKLYGYNTDVDGIYHALLGITLQGKNALIIGAGGAAKAIAYVLQKNNAHLYFLNRTPSKAQELAIQFEGQCVFTQHLEDQHFDLIINATPVGMSPNTQQSPLEGFLFTADQTIFDMVYNPACSRLLTQAKQAGATTISGIPMLVGQAFKQIELWQHLQQSLSLDSRIHMQQLETLITEITP